MNLNVWMPADYHMLPPNIETAGRFSTGRFGWFVPKALAKNNKMSQVISYTMFKDSSNIGFEQFVLDPKLLNEK